MGTLLSRIRTSLRNRKLKKNPTQQQEEEESPQSFAPTSQAGAGVSEGLADEHLATVSPPVTHTNTHAGQSISTATGVRDRDREIDTGEEEADKGKAKMSDEDYAAFLEKANRDPSEGVKGKEGVKGNGGKIELRATDGDGEGEVPRVLRAVVRDRVYVSDADEPFVGVSLKVEGGLPDESTFAKLVQHPSPADADVSIMDIGEWDVQGQYKDVVDAVREATKGNDVRVYRIEREGARVEYWVVGVQGGRLVGVKALAVES